MVKDSVDKQARRIQVLLDWRGRALSAGHAVPSTADVTRIAQTGEVWPAGIDVAVAEPWRLTIAEILHQVQFGNLDPIGSLASELRRPSGEVVVGSGQRARTDGEGVDPVVVALRRWREEQQDRPALQALKDNHLVNIARTRSQTAVEIARHLPRSLAELATEMSAVITAARRGGESGHGDERSTTRVTRSASPAAPPPPPIHPPPIEPPAGPPPGDPPPDPSDEERLKALDLRDGDYAADPPPHAIRRRGLLDGGTALSWPQVDGGGGVVLYRVVSIDDFEAPRRPQDATPIAVTTRLVHVDDRPFEGAARHVQVWCHVGRSEKEAAAALPALHAGMVDVAPPRDLSVREDGGHVTGRWGVFDRVERVEVARYDRDDWGRHDAQPTRLEWGDGNKGGFVDEDVVRGRRYVYTVATEVVVDGGRLLSDPVVVDLTVAGVLAAVDDLTVVERGDRVDLSWTTPPAGEVRIHRTPEGPAAGATTRPLLAAELETSAGLPANTRLDFPQRHGVDGRTTVAGVAFLAGMTRMYLTPVTVLGGQAQVGRTVPSVRLPLLEHAVIVERTHRQVLTFQWPPGADAVWVWVGGRDHPADVAIVGTPEEITVEQYERQGGMHFRHVLPSRGCSVHAAAVAFSKGRNVMGPRASLLYPGLARLRYTVGAARDKARRPQRVTVQIFADVDNASAPAFVLVHNPDRLPLHMDDGRPLPMSPAGDPGAVGGVRFRPSHLAVEPRNAKWSADVAGLTGYLRLFVCVTAERQATVALLDPPVAALRLDAPDAAR